MPSMLLAVALGALSVNPPSVPAKDSQQAILTVDRTSMVHLSTVNPAGSACEVVDHLRGPFATSGEVGKRNCDLDLLLDPGTYKVRIASPKKGKGTVAIKAEQFSEVNLPLLRLEPARTVEGTLRAHQQASYWIHVDGRQFVRLQVSGRTIGSVKLWRNGQWSEPMDDGPRVVTPNPGQPIHEWWIGRFLEAGDYLLTAYGTAAQKWLSGAESDSFSVSWLFDPMPPERAVDATIPSWGALSWGIPKTRALVSLQLAASPATPVDLELHPLDEDGSGSMDVADGSCRIEAKALRPECSTVANQERRHAIVVRGVPGARAHVEWARFLSSGSFSDGDFGPAVSDITFLPPSSGPYLVAALDSPADPDAAPLSCVLRRLRPNGAWELVGKDLVPLSPKKAYEKAFNYNGSEQALWFELEKGASFAFSTSGERKSRCELFRIEADGSRARLSESSTQPGCRVEKNLSPGSYELKLYGGDSGIETLKIVDTTRSLFGSSTPEKATFAKTGCLFADKYLEAAGATYRIEANRPSGVARGLVLRATPLSLDRLLSFELSAGRTLELPLAAGRALTVTADGPLACELGKVGLESKDGSCRFSEIAEPQALRLSSRGAGPITVHLSRPVPPATPLPLQAYNPTFAPVPQLKPDAPLFFDFGRSEAHSAVFDVKDAGLYHLSTVGLLSTSCAIRTPATPSLASDSGSGRGHNCLVAGFLRPGRYLATVTTLNQSRGRAGLVLSRRPVSPGPDVSVDGQAFFRVDADTLLQQRLSVGARGRLRLESIARGAPLSCRLEDKDGWPLLPVPTACALTQELEAGQYRWVQLPLTVESMRRTRLQRVKPPVVLSGSKPHEVGYNTWYAAKLSKSGKDEFRFDVEADLDVQLVLSDAMQGRLYRLTESGAPTPVEFISPQQVAPAASAEPPTEESGEGDEGPVPDAQRDAAPDGEGAPEGDQPLPRPPAYSPPVGPHVDEPTGQPLHLAAGHYQLITEHSRADVEVSYRLYLRSDTLAPGIDREIGAPTTLTVRVPREGVLRLRTEGETDVRCRLFDEKGRLAAESSGWGNDWNCALAEPVAAGDYRLVVESETLQPGFSHVFVAMPKLETLPPLADGAAIKLTSSVVVAPLPDVGEAVQEVSLKSTGAASFSCDVSGPSGLLARRSNVTECAFLLRPRGEKLSLRAWTLSSLVAVTAHLAAKPAAASGSTIPGDGSLAVAIPREGRYQTGPGAFCLPDSQRGALVSCGPEVSLEKGGYLFAALGAKSVGLSLDEQVIKAPAAPAPQRVRLASRPFIQTQKSSNDAIHLLRVSGLMGERSVPSCSLSGGARLLRESECFAAAGLSDEAVARAWTLGEESDAEVSRVAFKKPWDAIALTAGQQAVSWPTAPTRLTLPAQPARVELLLPAETWAVQLDAGGKVSDLCPPEKDLARCLLASRGGEIVVWGHGERRAEVSVVLGEVPAKAKLVAGLYETQPRLAGVLSVDIPAFDQPRRIEVEGARACSLRLADGTRIAACSLALPKGQAAEILLSHDGRPLRVTARPPDSPLDALFPHAASEQPAPQLAMAQAIPLVGSFIDRQITVEKAGVVHLRSDSGVCGLVQKAHVSAADGLAAGCEIHRLLEPGTYRVLVRPFDGQILTGTVSWTQTQIEAVSEGVGPERWLSPGQAQLFRFTLASAGRVGIGLQEPGETLACAVRDASQAQVADGCQQFLKLEAGSYLLEVHAPPGVPATRFRPVVVGLSGAKMEVPEDYLRDFFQRIGGVP